MASVNKYDAVRAAIANSNMEWQRCNCDLDRFFEELEARGYFVEEIA
ncbi:hypothetical protein ACFYU5_18980 [Nocardia aobensis]|uniref:Uncharacterized protein n=1 Tax=Nocardia aobensis TaxID=257277 RepID=A0ABW6P5R9_9NOCA